MANNPNNEDDDWATALVKRVGAQVKARRNGRSANWLSDRTADLGFRISPTVIAKLDSGHRGAVLGVTEWLILAAALDIPPILLLYPDLPDGPVEMIPDVERPSAWAAMWVAGDLDEFQSGKVLPEGMKLDHEAQQVLGRTRQRFEIEDRIKHLKGLIGQVDSDAVGNLTEQIARLEKDLRANTRWLKSYGATVEDPDDA